MVSNATDHLSFALVASLVTVTVIVSYSYSQFTVGVKSGILNIIKSYPISLHSKPQQILYHCIYYQLKVQKRCAKAARNTDTQRKMLLATVAVWFQAVRGQLRKACLNKLIQYNHNYVLYIYIYTIYHSCVYQYVVVYILFITDFINKVQLILACII